MDLLLEKTITGEFGQTSYFEFRGAGSLAWNWTPVQGVAVDLIPGQTEAVDATGLSDEDVLALRDATDLSWLRDSSAQFATLDGAYGIEDTLGHTLDGDVSFAQVVQNESDYTVRLYGMRDA